mgnify:CR=1 FL=1
MLRLFYKNFLLIFQLSIVTLPLQAGKTKMLLQVNENLLSNRVKSAPKNENLVPVRFKLPSMISN